VLTALLPGCRVPGLRVATATVAAVLAASVGLPAAGLPGMPTPPDAGQAGNAQSIQSNTMRADTVPVDAVRTRQWPLHMLRLREAWKHADGRNVIVAVLDSGVDGEHPDLSGRVLTGADFVDGGDGRTDTVGHGTTVAALIAGQDDPTGVVGIAHHARILPVRVLDRKNRYRDAGIVAKGLRWAVDHGARVVNLSLGGSLHSTELAEAIQYAYDRDVVVVACGGNKGDDNQIWYPAREPGVVAVTGLDRDGLFWRGSLSGPDSSLSAPASGIVGIGPDGYQTVRGTSFAAALVSATAALIRSHWPDMSAANVVNRLIRTARDLGPTGRDDRYGFGVVDPVAALSNPVASVRENPLDTTPRSPDPSRSWALSPATRGAVPGTGDGAPWWWLGLGMLGAGGFALTVGLVVRRHRRGRLPAPPPWDHPY
jgi:type VII secretion-associated serine protease mycosin